MKKDNISLIVIGTTITMLLIVLIGSTFAYFTALNSQGSTSLVSIEGGKMLINYSDGTSDILTSKDIEPSNTILVNKTFTLTGTNTTNGLKMPYKVGLKYNSTFSDGMIHYYIKRTTTNENVTSNYVVTPEANKTESDYLNQTIPGNASKTGYTHGTLKIGKKYTEMVTGEFKENKENQSIEFNLIIQFPDNGLNQDSEKGKTFNGKVVVNYEAPTPKTFAEDTWETIADNTSSNVYNVGDTKTVLIGNKPYTVRIANKSTPEECTTRDDFSQTACGFVVEFADILEERRINSNDTNKGGWPATTTRTYANGTFFNNLPEELRNIIIDTKVVSGYGSSDNNAKRPDGNWESNDKIYLLSEGEVFKKDPSITSSSNDTAYKQTRQLDYYANKGVTITDNKSATIKKNKGSNGRWWLRGATSNFNDAFFCVHHTGDSGVIGTGNGYSAGFAPAFRIG